MTTAEREIFLEELHVGVLAVARPDRGPLTLPIWYLVDGGDVVMHANQGSLKVQLLEAASRATLVVQTETPPYRYASVEGPVRFGPVTVDPFVLAARYLGEELGRWYADERVDVERTVEVRLRPEHWNTYDFGKVL